MNHVDKWDALAALAREAAADALVELRRADQSAAHYITGLVHVIAVDRDGERIGPALVAWHGTRELFGPAIADAVRSCAPAQYASIQILGEVAMYESKASWRNAERPLDPHVSAWSVADYDIPGRGERIPLEDCGPAPGPGVAQRIDAFTVKQQRKPTGGIRNWPTAFKS